MNATPATPADIPDDDLARTLAIADPEAPDARHISLAGDTYTMLLAGDQTDGRYCLIDMYIPDGGGPPPHRHDFEEMFTILEGQVGFTFRGQTRTVSAPATVNIPANAPHFFRNASGSPARMLCMCTPAGQDEFFAQVGDPVGSRTAPPPPLNEEQVTERQRHAQELAARYRTEMLA
jgi:quercetin dioxygenase-like cupin family protein